MTKRAQNGGWTREMDDIVRQAAKDGLTATQTVAKLDYHKSRSAILGRAHRLGVSFLHKVQLTKEEGGGLRALAPNEPRPAPKDARKRIDGKKVAVERVGGPKRRPAAKVNKGNFKPTVFGTGRPENFQSAEERRKEAEETRVQFIERMKEMDRLQPGIPFMKRKGNQCAAMFGTGMHANCCGKRVTFRPDGQLSSYCADHHKLYNSGRELSSRLLRGAASMDKSVVALKALADGEEEIAPVDRLIADDDENDDAQQAA